jgi:integrase
MASIRVNARKDKPPTFSVLWRDPETGTQTSTTFPDRQEAERFARVLKANGNYLAPTTGMWNALHRNSPTVTVILAEHIDMLPRVTPRGKADYRRDAKKHLIPHLGAIPVDALTEAHVNQWLITLSDTTMSDKTIANMHGLLSSAVSTAVKAGHCPSNPCRGVRLPRRDHSAEMVFLSPQQWTTLDTELGKISDGYYQLMFRTLAYTGMRWGEVTALQVGDLMLNSKPPMIRISRALRRDENSRPYIGPTKTNRSKRTISIHQALADELRDNTKGKPPGRLVFPSHAGSTLHSSNVRVRAWLPAVNASMNDEEYGAASLTVQPRVHDLRHSHASWLFSQGLDLLAVQRRLGHESITTTADRYGHLLLQQQVAVADALGEMFG